MYNYTCLHHHVHIVWMYICIFNLNSKFNCKLRTSFIDLLLLLFNRCIELFKLYMDISQKTLAIKFFCCWFLIYKNNILQIIQLHIIIPSTLLSILQLISIYSVFDILISIFNNWKTTHFQI